MTTSRCRLPVGLLSSTERNPRLPCWYVNLASYPGHSMSYTRIILCIVVHSDCRFQQCSMAVLVFIPAFGHTLQQCISRQGLDTFYCLYRSVKWICLQVISLRQRRVTVFAPSDTAFESIELENLTNSAICQITLLLREWMQLISFHQGVYKRLQVCDSTPTQYHTVFL